MGGCSSYDTASRIEYSVYVGNERKGETRVFRNPKFRDGLLTTPSGEMSTLFDLVQKSFSLHARNPMLGTKTQYGYVWKTYQDVKDLATSFGSGLEALELCPEVDADGSVYKFLGLYSKNREEWTIADLACIYYNITTVPFYDALGAESMEYMLEQTGLITLFISQENLPRILKLKSEGKTSDLKYLILMERASDELRIEVRDNGLTLYDMSEIISHGWTNKRDFKRPGPNNVYTICYTSGTTGYPKGVILPHGGMLAGIGGVMNVFTPSPNDVHLSYLPLAHVYERVVSLALIHSGSSIGYFGGDVLKLKEDLAELRPTILPCVPRLLNRFYDAIQGSLKSQTGLKAKLIEKACKVKLDNLYNGTNYTHSLYDSLVFKKIKQVLGGRVRLAVTASAPISPDVLSFLKIAFCCPILEAYGQTETCGAATATLIDDPDSGHVGGPIACCEIKLVDIPEMNYTSTTRDDKMNLTPCGEICFRGPNVTPGYFKLPDKTAEVIDEEGWLHSGDVGMIRPDGSLRLIDRKKNIFKLAQGEYVAPEKIENVYVLSKYVASCYVHGDSLQSYLIAIVVPEESHIRELAKKHEVEGELKDLCQTPQIIKDVLADMTQVGKASGLLSFEQAKKVYLHSEPFTIESGLLTPTFKIKRFDAKNYFSEVIQYLYSEPLATNQ